MNRRPLAPQGTQRRHLRSTKTTVFVDYNALLSRLQSYHETFLTCGIMWYLVGFRGNYHETIFKLEFEPVHSLLTHLRPRPMPHEDLSPDRGVTGLVIDPAPTGPYHGGQDHSAPEREHAVPHSDYDGCRRDCRSGNGIDGAVVARKRGDPPRHAERRATVLANAEIRIKLAVAENRARLAEQRAIAAEARVELLERRATAVQDVDGDQNTSKKPRNRPPAAERKSKATTNAPPK